MNDKRIRFLEKSLAVLFVVWSVILFWSLAGMQIVLGLIVFDSLLLKLVSNEKPIKFHPFYIWCGIYVLINLFISALSQNVVRSLISFMDNDWVIFTVPFIVSLNLSARWRKIVFQALLVSAVLAALYGIFQFFSGLDIIRNKMLGPFGSHYRAEGAYGSFLTYAGNQLMVFACAYAAFLLSSNKRLEKTGYLAAAGILFISIVASESRGTWLAVPVILLIGLIAVPRKQLLYATGTLLAVAIVITLAVPEISSRALSIFNLAQNEARLNLWKTSLAIISDHPLLGIGYGNFNDYVEIYRIPGYYDARGHAHNDYLNNAVMSGIPGLLAWLGIWVSWFIYTVRTYLKLPFQDDDKKIVLGTILALSGILLAALFQCFYTDLENNIVWWFMAVIGLQISMAKANNKLTGKI
jgi:putative inorganic carbon (HCO3(-)) transporter